MPFVHSLAHVVIERGRLQEREHAGEAIVPDHIRGGRLRHRRCRAASAVATSSCAWSVLERPLRVLATRAAPRSVSAIESSGSHDQPSSAFTRPWEMPRPARPLEGPPGSRGRRSHFDLAGVDRAQASDRSHEVRGARHHSRPRPLRATGNTWHSASLGGQREERLVLDLFEPAGPDLFRASVPDRVPRGRDELAVLRHRDRRS